MSIADKLLEMNAENTTQSDLIGLIGDAITGRAIVEQPRIRPADFPQYPESFLEEEAVYFTVDTTAHEHPFFAITTSVNPIAAANVSYIISRGSIENDAFVGEVLTTMTGKTHFRDWTPKTSKYVVYQIKPSEGTHIQGWAWTYSPEYNGGGFSAYVSPVVEVFGYAPEMIAVPSNFVNTNQNGTWPLTTVSVTLKGCKPRFLAGLFNGCRKMIYCDVADWDVSAVTDMRYCFASCVSLREIDVSDWDVSAVTNMPNVFDGCNAATFIGVRNWDVSACTSFYNMFSGCYAITNIDVSLWNPISATSFYQMFNGCRSLKSVNMSRWQTPNLTTLNNMFLNCFCLETLDMSSFDCSKVTNYTGVASYCYLLRRIVFGSGGPISATFRSALPNDNSCEYLDMRNIDASMFTDLMYAFTGFMSLVDFFPFQHIAKELNISDAPRLSVESLLRIIDALDTVSTTTKLTLGTVNRNKLTAEQLQVAIDKGWTLA